MTLIVGLITGLLAGRVVWLMSRRIFDHPVFARNNFRGVALPTGTGVTIALTIMAVESVRLLLGRMGYGAEAATAPRVGVIVLVISFGLLGLLDDIAGGGDARGFKGHLGSLFHGQLTTGSLKLFGGAACALIAVAITTEGSTSQLLVDAALVALSANLANLFDRAPGRSIKFSAFVFAIIAVATRLDDTLAPMAVVIGAAGALFLDDVKERIMLGDAGANAIGAVVGFSIVASCSTSTRMVALVVVIGLNLLSEVVSFSRVINAVGPARMADQAGRAE